MMTGMKIMTGRIDGLRLPIGSSSQDEGGQRQGKRYSFRLSSELSRQSAPCWYEMRFQTEKERWIEIDLPIDRFQAVRRGRQPFHAPDLNLDAIDLFGFLISDQQEGDFRLEIQKVEAVPRIQACS